VKSKSRWAPGLGVRVLGAQNTHGQWVILAVGGEVGVCPDCGTESSHRHGWHARHLQDLPAQGAGVTVKLRIQRWQCRNKGCKRKTFAAQLPETAAPLARRTTRAAELVYLFGHGVGGRPGERLLKRIGMPISDDTILRSIKRRAKERRAETSVRVVGLDDWAWRKGSTYGTIIVDLERREVIDLFPDRSASATAGWLKQHPEIEIVNRDRCGSFAQGAHEGAPEARQIADRFHILQNLHICRICARPFRRNSAASWKPPRAAYCQRTSTMKVRRRFRAAHGINTVAPSIAVSPEWRTSNQDKRSLSGSERSIWKADPSATLYDRRGSTAARSLNGSRLTRLPSATPQRQRQLHHVTLKNTSRAAGRKVACMAGVYSRRSKRVATLGVSQISMAFSAGGSILTSKWLPTAGSRIIVMRDPTSIEMASQ
jgi:Transposase/zinc-finger of transposase IS204/IS1001/IS1096/IS1165